MGLFSSIFGSDDGSKKASRVMRQNLDYVRGLQQADQADRDSIYAGLQPEIDYANGVDKEVVGDALDWGDKNRNRSDVMWKRYKQNVMPVEDVYYREALAAGGEADQNRAAGRAVSDIRQQQDIARAGMNRDLASMGVNPNSSRFGSANRAAELMAMAAAAGGATNAREGQRRWGMDVRGEAVDRGRTNIDAAKGFGDSSLAANIAASGIAGNAVNRGLAAGQFKVGGRQNFSNSISGASGGYASALQNTDTTGLVPGLLGFGSSFLTAPKGSVAEKFASGIMD